MFKESIKMSWQNIINNKMRSFLTVLGVMIGVASVIALISIVQAVTTNITGQVMDMGANKVSVQLTGTPLKQGLTTSDINNLESIDNLKGVSPSVVGKTSIVYDGNVMEDVTVQGKNEVHFANTQDLVKAGRSITAFDIQSGNRVCLVGADIVQSLFATKSPIDQQIRINGISYTVIGVLEENSDLLAGSSSNEVMIPYTSAMSLLSTGYVSAIDFYIEDESLSESTTANIESVLLSSFNYDEDGYSITNMQSILDTVNEMTGTMSMLLAGIAAISLVVGGVGIMNMMLVIVTERTAEIGLRKALGAKPSAIQTQFILEALFLSLFGGIMGLIFGTIISFAGCLLIRVEFTLVSYAIPLAIGFAAAIGLVFGYAPAKRASKLNPIDALRSE